jgi:hypothetical protein
MAISGTPHRGGRVHIAYRGLTREAYTLDLRQFAGWCRARTLPLFSVRRADIETFARELEARGRARATVTRRLCAIGGFYKYAMEEELLEHSLRAQRPARVRGDRGGHPAPGPGARPPDAGHHPQGRQGRQRDVQGAASHADPARRRRAGCPRPRRSAK